MHFRGLRNTLPRERHSFRYKNSLALSDFLYPVFDASARADVARDRVIIEKTQGLTCSRLHTLSP